MLFVFYGSEQEKLYAKSKTLITGLLKKRPDAAHVVFTDETFDPSLLNDLLFGQALFGGSFIVELSGVMARPEVEEVLVAAFSDMATSPNIIVMREGVLTAPLKKKIERYAEKVVEITAPKKPAVERFNTFVIGDAVYRRSKKDAWAALAEAQLVGIPDEEIAGSLWFSMKALLAAGRAQSAEEAGLSPFPFQKAKRALSAFKDGEVEQMADALISLYHEAHRGEVPMGLALERWILKV